MNATAGLTDLDYFADTTLEWGSERLSVLEPDHSSQSEIIAFNAQGSSSAFLSKIDPWLAVVEPLRHVRQEYLEAVHQHVNATAFVNPQFFVHRFSDTINVNVKEYRFFLQDTMSSEMTDTVIFVAFGEAKGASGTEYEAEYQEVVDDLRQGGRELLAKELFELLRNALEDPEEPEIKFFSLQAMARFLIRHKHYDDPIFGPDPRGLVQIEWHIDGDGLLVMAFLEEELIHCVVQADATPEREVLNKSVLLTENQAVEEFGYLVPLR